MDTIERAIISTKVKDKQTFIWFSFIPMVLTDKEKMVKEKIKESLILSGYYFVEVIERVIKSGT